MDKALVIYHKDDVDGIMSGYYLADHLIAEGYEAMMCGMSYGDSPPSMEGFKKVAITDFSLEPIIMNQLYNEGRLLWYDHHATAIEQSVIRGYDKADGVRNEAWSALYLVYTDTVGPATKLIKLMDAYDTWKNEDEAFFYDAKGLNAYLMSMNEDSIIEAATSENALQCVNYGHAILQSERQKVIDSTFYKVTLGGDRVFTAINYYSNEATDIIGGPIAMFRFIGAYVNVSLRGDDGLGDVARHYGGGGHSRAAGFNIDMQRWINMLELPKA